MINSVLIRVQNVELFLHGTLEKSIRDKIQQTLSYYVPNFRFTKKYKQDEQKARLGLLDRDPWDGKVTVARRYYTDNGILRAPTGLLSFVREILEADGINYEIRDERSCLVKAEGYSTPDLVLRDYQEEAVKKAIERGRGVIKASTGCHKKGQKILMYNGFFKNIEDIVVGDKMMGPDSKPRQVLGLCRGYGKMYKIIPNLGESFIVNEDHVLTLVRTNKTKNHTRLCGKIIDISVKEWIQWTPYQKHLHKLFKTGIEEFETSSPVSLDPYLIGLFLSDGILGSGTGQVCTTDNEVVNFLSEYALQKQMRISKYTTGGRTPAYAIVNKKRGRIRNPITVELEKLRLLNTNAGTKFVPTCYKTASRLDRLKLLAGYLDGDGHNAACPGGNHGYFEAASKSKELAEGIVFVARSLGFYASVRTIRKRCCNNNKWGTYYRLGIGGKTEEIPCLIERRKTFRKSPPRKNSLRSGFKIKEVSPDLFFGFTLDGDGRYLLEDFTVTHNSGKTEMVTSMIVRASVFPAVFYVNSCDLLEQARDRLEKYVRLNGQPTKIGKIGNGHCDIRPITVATIQSTWRALFPGKKIEHNEFDDYKPDDKTELDESQKKAVAKLAREAQFVYLDEAHHVSASTMQDVLNVSHNAKMRFGGSASPWRDDGLDILIEACFGKRFCDISASFLINSGYLVRPQITFNHFNQSLGYANDWASIYNDYVVENDARNRWIAERAKLHISHQRPTIILVKLVKHAKLLKELLPEAEVLTSSGGASVQKSPKRRKEVLDRMRSREVMCIIGTTLLDEGVDVPSAGAGIFAGGGKSSTRELQRVGRFMRKDPADPDKETAYIEEFHDHCQWLSSHAKARREILKTEREFVIDDHRVI